MNTKRFIYTVIAGFIFTFLFDWVVHGTLLMDMYLETPELWRPMEEMTAYHNWMLLVQILTPLVAAYIFIQNYEGGGVKEGVRFGVMIGLLLGICMFGSYAYMPISMTLALSWLIGTVVYGVGLGIVFALVYKK